MGEKPLSKTYIKCEKCGKEIQKKGTRVLCVRCTNEKNREIAKKYREENSEHVKELYAKRYARVKAQSRRED